MAEESSGLGRQLSVNEGKKEENERKEEEEESDEKKSKDVEAQNNSDGDDGDEEEELPFPGFSPKSFFILKQTNMLRYFCLRTITNPWFERCSMMVILLNCLTLGMYKPCDDQVCSTTRCRVLEGFDHFIFAFFAVEMLIKMIAMGICGKDTYLADSWNKLDCFIVLAGAVEYGIDT